MLNQIHNISCILMHKPTIQKNIQYYSFSLQNICMSLRLQFNLYIFYRMQELSNDNLQLNLIDTTSVFTKQINNNIHFDGSTLVYLAGAHILFHNVYQNSKQFLQRASDNDVMAIAFHHSTQIAVLLVTKDPFCHVEFYFYGKKSVTVDIHQELEVLDAVFLEKKRVCLLAFDRIKKETSLIIVTSNKKVKKVDLAEKCFKISGNQRKMYILAQLGCYEMNIETEMLQKKKVYQSISLKNIIITQNEEDILFDKSSRCYLMQDYRQKQTFLLTQHFQRQKVEYQSAYRIGHNLLVTIKGQFIIAHYIIEENKLQFVNKFQYSEKVRGNIIAMDSSVDQMNLAIALQTTYKDRTRIQHFLFNLSALANEKKFINPFLKLQSGGEIGEVSNFQCIIPSQMYCLVGPHIINYTYIEHIEKKHKYSIHQSPKYIAVHPLGHQLLCIFETAFKFYQKVEMELVETWTQPMICSCARYTQSGLLILCVYQEGIQNIVVYNPNNFRRMRTFNGLYLKHAVSRIDLDEFQQQLILYSQKDLFIHRFKTGERLSQFRQKRQMTDVTCIQYDFIRKWLLVASRQNIIICKKTEDYLLNFNSQKVIQVDHEVTCIRINEHAQTIFFGTSNGVILYTSYPLIEINEQTVQDHRIYRAVYQSVKIHSQPIANILLTNNCKFLFTSIKGDGISILRAKRLNNGKGTYNPFDSSNYNFIETSSTPYLQNIQEKLKNLLQKRKTIFNELDQFKKEWQGKRIAQTKKLTTQNKRKELSYINTALEEINKCKLEHAALIAQLSSFQSLTLTTQEQNQKIHHKELLLCYEENDKRKEKLKNVQKKCQDQWSDISSQCSANIEDIRQQLQAKFRNFQTTYLTMKSNLVNYRRRMQFEQSEDIAVRQQLIATTKSHLKQEQEQLYRRNNELKGQITKNRKQLQRFVNRKDFLQNKQRFFVQQLKYCDNEQNQLIEVKENLQKQLVQLEDVTHKKEKRLRKYFIQNQILIKYQIIHDNLSKQSNKQIEFIEGQHQRLRHNIGQLQKEILFVSQQRQKHKKQLQIKKYKLQCEKAQNIKLKQKRDFLALQIQQIEDSINATNTGKIVDQESKNQDFMAIYQKFFIQKKLQTFLSSRQAKTDELIVSENKRSQLGVKAVLQDHKEYLVRNMQLFEKYNTRVMDEINLTYLKYQTENYDLISQCNIRKEQINKKKRTLHQLVNSIRQTNTHIAALHQSRPIHKQPSHPPPQIPFPIYEQNQHQNQQKPQLKKDKSESAMWKIKKSSYQVRKMLQIQKLKSNNNYEPLQKDKRRIQTATLKNKTHEYHNEQIFAQQSLDVMNPMGFMQYEKKPQTAFHRYRKKQNQQAKRLFSRNKSNSKPTTCTSHTKSKKSLFI